METKYYFPGALAEQIDRLNSADMDAQKSDLLRDFLFVLLFFPAASLINSLFFHAIEKILLRNFPEWCWEWVYVKPWLGEKEVKLGRWQRWFSGVVGLGAILVWMMTTRMRLWEGIVWGFGVLVAAQMVVVLGLLLLDIFMGTAAILGRWSGWLPYPLGVMVPVDEQDLAENRSIVRYSDQDLPQARSLVRYSEQNLSSPGPRSNGRVSQREESSSSKDATDSLSSSWLAKNTLALLPTSPAWPPFKSFKIQESKNAANGIETYYHSLSANPQNKLSFEEMRLQHYRQKEAKKQKNEERVPPVSVQPVDSAIDRSSWLKIRDFGKSIFSSSTASTDSRDTFGQSPKLGRHGLVPMAESSSWSPTMGGPRGSQRARRSFL